MSFATLNGVSCSRLRAQVSDWGAWWVDVNLAEPAELSGAATVALADVVMQGTIVAGAAFDGRAAYRVVGGRGGWGKTIVAKPYVNDAGVKVSGIIADAARDAGELVGELPATKLDSHFARRNAPASHVLHTLAPQAWRVDFDGVTRFGKRPVIAYSGDGTRTRLAPSSGITEIATESIAQLIPGVTIDGSAPAVDVEYELNATRLTVRVYVGRTTARRLLGWRNLFDGLFPELPWSKIYEFRVVEQVGNRFNLQVVRSATGLPDLELVPARGAAGVRATVQPGELVLVAFIEADPARPVIIAHDEIDSPGWMPLFLQLGEEPTLGVARIGDAVICGPYAGTIVAASTRIKAGS